MFEKLARVPVRGIFADGYAHAWEIAQMLAEPIAQLKPDEIVRWSDARVEPERRKWATGGLNLTPFGYYHPSECFSVITDNGSRGRLLKKNNGGERTYVFDFDAKNRLVHCTWNSLYSRTFGEHIGNKAVFVTVWKDQITHVYITEYGENGMLDVFAMFDVWDWKSRVMPDVCECYGPLENGERRLVFAQTDVGERFCRENIYRLFYNADGVAQSCEALQFDKLLRL